MKNFKTSNNYYPSLTRDIIKRLTRVHKRQRRQNIASFVGAVLITFASGLSIYARQELKTKDTLTHQRTIKFEPAGGLKLKPVQKWVETLTVSIEKVTNIMKNSGQKTYSGVSCKALIAKLKTAEDGTLPYGLKMVADGFVHKMNSILLSKKLNDLNADLFVDYEDPRRMKVSIALLLHRLWLKSGNQAYKFIKDYPGPVEFRALRLSKGANFDLYSLIAYEQLDCNNCEYGLYQTVNILVTISKSRIVDHITGAFTVGNDLGNEHRYLYIDSLMKIYSVDIVSDEVGADFRHLQSWSIDSSGHFIKKIQNKL